jgi:hypothetical protein
MQRMIFTTKDLEGLEQPRVPPPLLWCRNSLHDHNKSPQKNVHVRQAISSSDVQRIVTCCK